MTSARELLDEIVQFLLPHVDQPPEREALLHAAFIDHPELVGQVDFYGEAFIFAKKNISRLLYVEVRPEKSAVALILEELKSWVSHDQHADIDTLLARLNQFLREKQAFQQNLNTPAAEQATTPHSVSDESPLMLNIPRWLRLPLGVIGVLVFVAAVFVTGLWINNPDAGNYEPLIVLLAFVSTMMFSAADRLANTTSFRKNRVPRWLRVTLGVIGTLISTGGVIVTGLWIANPDAPYEPLIVFCLTLGPALLAAASSESLGLGWVVWPWQRKSPEERVLRALEDGWIEGFLKAALREVREFAIRLTDNRELVVNHEDYGDVELEDSANIQNVYAALEGKMLILGKPGAGKTIMLLQLAESLMKNARADMKNGKSPKIPLVFNLSSWARSETPVPLAQWIVTESRESYNARAGWISEWRDNNNIILLLDGLDEIRDEWRGAHVAAINQFREDYPLIPMVVSSRIEEYEELKTRLELRGAVRLRDLDIDEVDAYLSSQPDLATLHQLTGEDEIVREMSTTPFLLNTMVYTYSAVDNITALRGPATPAARRQHLFQRYVDRRLDGRQLPYSKQQATDYLTYLATKMQITNVTAFRPSDINGNWLRSEPRLHTVHQWIIRLLGGVPPIAFAFAVGWVRGGLLPAVGLAVVIGALLSMFFGWLGDSVIEKAATVGLPRLTAIWRSIIRIDTPTLRDYLVLVVLPAMLGTALIGMFGVPLMSLVLVSLIIIATVAFDRMSRYSANSLRQFVIIEMTLLILAITATVIVGNMVLAVLTVTTAVSLVGAVNWVFSSIEQDDLLFTASPRLGWIAFIFTALIFWLSNVGVSSAVEWPLVGLVATGLWLVCGGLLMLDDWLSRLSITFHQKLPIRITNFMQHLVTFNIIRERGGGYQFIHRYLLESFAGEDEILILIEALRDDLRREQAVEQFVALGERVVEPLMAALTDSEDGVRGAAAEALGKIGDERAVKPLMAALADSNGDVHWAAAEALGKIGQVAVAPLIVALADSHGDMRGAVRMALENIGAPAVPSLITVMVDGNDDVRQSAVAVLERIGRPAVDPLTTALMSDDANTRLRVAEVLVKMGWEPETDRERAWLTVIQQRWHAAVIVGEEAVEPLLAILADSDRDIRQAVVEALGQIGDPRAVAPLLAILADNDRDIRQAVVEALGNIGDERAVQPLIAALGDEDRDVRYRAARALGNIGDERAVQPLDRKSVV